MTKKIVGESNSNLGSSFDDFLDEEGILSEVRSEVSAELKMRTPTPGPWRIKIKDQNERPVIMGSDDMGVCEMSLGFWDDDIQPVANAHLVAASPQMLKMIKNKEWIKVGCGIIVCIYCQGHAPDSNTNNEKGHAHDCEYVELMNTVQVPCEKTTI